MQVECLHFCCNQERRTLTCIGSLHKLAIAMLELKLAISQCKK